MFVLDGSSSADTAVVQEALALLEELRIATGDNGAAVNVCVVKFKRLAEKSEWFKLSTEYDKIEAAMTKSLSGGTNLHAGLLAGLAALEDHSDIPAARKYLILVSDGSTYLYCKENKWDLTNERSDTNPDGYFPYTRSYYPTDRCNSQTGGFWDNDWYEPNSQAGNIPRPKNTSDVDTWEAYLADVKARNERVNEADQQTGDYYDYEYDYANHGNQPFEGYIPQPCEPRTANNRDMAYYYADQVWRQIEEKCNAYSIATKDGMAGPGNADDSRCFMNYLNGDRELRFSDIKNEIIYLVDAGSFVNDYMGYAEGDYNFDLVNQASKLYITEGKTRLDAVEIETNKYGFGMWEEDDGTVGYKYVVTYTPAADGEEHIEWTINVPVTNLRHVQLHYTVELMNPKTAVGTYGTYDEDGSKGYDGLYTNNRATLYPMATGATKTGEGEDFLKPTVSYEVKGGGGTIITPVKPDPKPDPEPPTDIDDGNTPADPGSDIDEPETPTTPAEPPKTGDMMPLFAGMAAVSAAAIALLGRKRKEA